MTTPDQATWQRTRDYMAALLDLCSDLGGKVLVLGSPKQRSILENQTKPGAWKRAVDLLSSVVDRAGQLGLTICFEPLSPVETNFINTVDEGMKLVREVNHPSFKIHLDVKAMCSEGKPVPAIIRSVKVEDVGHFHVNDPNLYGPGMGEVDYAPIAEAVQRPGVRQMALGRALQVRPRPRDHREKEHRLPPPVLALTNARSTKPQSTRQAPEPASFLLRSVADKRKMMVCTAHPTG